jgi:membrane associated rhomboid family serine protease
MFPIRDHNPSERVPFVTYALVGMNALIFLYMWPLYGTTGASRVFVDYGMIPARLSQGGGFETLITSMFVHGGFMHFAGNMLFLWVFGDNLEDMLGHVRFLLFYLATGVAAA